MQTQKINRILVIQTASIGDVILVTPVLEKLHLQYPHAQLDLLIKQGYESLFEGHPFIHEVWLWDKRKDKYKNLWTLIQQVQNRNYDLTVNVQRFFSTGLLTVFSRSAYTIGFDKNPLSLFFSKRVKHSIQAKGENMHEVDRNLLLVKHLDAKVVSRPKLYPTNQHYAKVSQYKTHGFICVAPASLWFTKQFPEERWVEFLQQVPPDIYVYLLGSASDFQLCERILLQSKHPNILNLSGKLSLLESAALMRDALMNYVNDSSPMHLCSSVNARTTAIYCSTVTAYGFGPLSSDAVVVETDEKLTCRPCGLHGHQSCPKKHFKCATGIEIGKLLNRLEIGK